MKTNEYKYEEIGEADTAGAYRRRGGDPAIPLLVLVLIGLVTFGIVIETNIISIEMSTSPLDLVPPNDHWSCSPRVLEPSTIKYHSRHSYYSALREKRPPPPPVFHHHHTELCDDTGREERKYSYCLPISGRTDTPFCETPDRLDLLEASKPICYASVLHMLLVEVYEELQVTGNTPFLIYGSLLGAVRNQSVIPFTEDADLGFVGELLEEEALKSALWQKGYHMFLFDIWRVCVAPTHPLAGVLYDSSLPLSRNFTVPYLDLYAMKYTEYGDWKLQEFEGPYGPYLLDSRVRPFSQATINGMAFDTLHDPTYFLKEAYGDDYMTPKPREDQSSSVEEMYARYQEVDDMLFDEWPLDDVGSQESSAGVLT